VRDQAQNFVTMQLAEVAAAREALGLAAAVAVAAVSSPAALLIGIARALVA